MQLNFHSESLEKVSAMDYRRAKLVIKAGRIIPENWQVTSSPDSASINGRNQ